MKYKGKELDVFKSDENIAFNPPHQMLVWDRESDEPLVRHVAAFCPSRLNAVIINDSGTYRHCAEIPKSKTNWDEYQKRRNIAKLSLERGIEIFKEHDIPCIFCPARKLCNTAASGFRSCTETFAAWAKSEYVEEK